MYHSLLSQPDSEGQRELILKLMYQEELRRTKEIELEILKLKVKSMQHVPHQHEQFSNAIQPSVDHLSFLDPYFGSKLV